MGKLNHESSCPVCGRGSVQRIQRRSWVKMVPGSKCYRCRSCGAKLVQIPGGFVWRMRGRNGGSRHAYSAMERSMPIVRTLVIAMLLAGCVYFTYSLIQNMYNTSTTEEIN